VKQQMNKNKPKPTTEAWEKLKAERTAGQIAVEAENKKIIRQIDVEVSAARLKFKKHPYGVGTSQRLANQAELFKLQPLSKQDDPKHPKFSRGLVRKNIGGVEFMLPAKKGSGSRGSPGWKK